MGEIINVAAIAKAEKEKLRQRIESARIAGKGTPTLATVLVGEDPGSVYYLDMQKRTLEALGGTMLKITLGGDASEEELLETLQALNDDDKVHGIMVLFPLPKTMDAQRIAEAIDPKKDIDGIHPLNIGLLASTPKEGIAPCTPMSVVEILKAVLGDLKGRHAVIIGRSNIVGKPLIQLLLREQATVTVCHSRTADLPAVARTGEILISAMGRPLMITNEYVGPGAVVIDVGTSELEGQITGDCDLSSVLPVASWATKVPGGVGTLTTTILMRTLTDLFEASTPAVPRR